MDEKKEKFSQIYDQYIDKIYRFIFLKVNSQEVAQDLTSETFLRTWKKFKDNINNPINNLKAFLYKTARNLVIDYYRNKDKFKLVSIDSVLMPDSNDLTEKAARNSDLNIIRTNLAELKDDYQNVIIWHYLEGFSIPEVAKLLDRTEQATRVLLHRALKSLKDKCNKLS